MEPWLVRSRISLFVSICHHFRYENKIFVFSNLPSMVKDKMESADSSKHILPIAPETGQESERGFQQP